MGRPNIAVSRMPPPYAVRPQEMLARCCCYLLILAQIRATALALCERTAMAVACPARDRLRRGKDLRMAEGEEPQSTKRSRTTTRQDNNARISHGGCRNSVADGCAPASHGG